MYAAVQWPTLELLAVADRPILCVYTYISITLIIIHSIHTFTQSIKQV